jgi:O-succinylbenzoic acid--CoA ligase
VKVSAQALAERIRLLPEVEAVEVLGVPDDEWGQRVVAFVVGDVALDEVRAHVAAELPREWAPRQVVTLPDLPLLDNGKVHRLMLRDLA